MTVIEGQASITSSRTLYQMQEKVNNGGSRRPLFALCTILMVRKLVRSKYGGVSFSTVSQLFGCNNRRKRWTLLYVEIRVRLRRKKTWRIRVRLCPEEEITKQNKAKHKLRRNLPTNYYL